MSPPSASRADSLPGNLGAGRHTGEREEHRVVECFSAGCAPGAFFKPVAAIKDLTDNGDCQAGTGNSRRRFFWLLRPLRTRRRKGIEIQLRYEQVHNS